jgi:hypothetical protein
MAPNISIITLDSEVEANIPESSPEPISAHATEQQAPNTSIISIDEDLFDHIEKSFDKNNMEQFIVTNLIYSQIEIFTDKSATSFGGKILGNADSIRVNQIEFDRASLSKAYTKTIFTEGLPKKQIIYAPQGVAPYETSSDYWDGTFNGVLQPIDSYVWIAEAIGTDGKQLKRRGQSILIR